MIPIIITTTESHPGKCLDTVIQQAKKANNIVQVLNSKTYESIPALRELKKVYRHKSPNAEWYEFHCIARWFMIHEYMRRGRIDVAFCMDHDVMVYCDVEKVWYANNYGAYHQTVINGSHVMSVYMESWALGCWTDWILNFFSSEKELKAHTDIFLMEAFLKETGLDAFDLMTAASNSVFDHNINCSEGCYEMNENGIKNYKIIGGDVFVRRSDSLNLVRFNTLHFQGTAKRYIS